MAEDKENSTKTSGSVDSDSVYLECNDSYLYLNNNGNKYNSKRGFLIITKIICTIVIATAIDKIT